VEAQEASVQDTNQDHIPIIVIGFRRGMVMNTRRLQHMLRPRLIHLDLQDLEEALEEASAAVDGDTDTVTLDNRVYMDSRDIGIPTKCILHTH
jgi:hypothetical protein